MNNLKNRKIIFFGTPDFTLDFLDLFKSINLNLISIVTSEDKPFGRGQELKSPKPKTWGDKFSIKTFQPKKLDDHLFEVFKKMEPDLFIVIAYGKIIPEKFINLPKFGTINLHYSLLPRYRGASPVESAILNSDPYTGLCIQQMTYELDAGDILLEEQVPILDNETTSELRNKLNKRALEVFPEFLEKFFEGKVIPKKQSIVDITKCGKFKKEDLDVTEDLQKEKLTKNFTNIYKKFKAYDKKIYFFHPFHEKKIRVKIVDMNPYEILRLLPESRKAISLKEFEQAFGII